MVKGTKEKGNIIKFSIFFNSLKQASIFNSIQVHDEHKNYDNNFSTEAYNNPVSVLRTIMYFIKLVCLGTEY